MVRPTLEREAAPEGDSTTPPRPDQWQRIVHLTATLDRSVRITQMADGKVAPVLAVHATLAAVTVSQAGTIGSALAARSLPVWAAIMVAVLLGAYAVLSLLSFRQVALVYVPSGSARAGGRSLFFYGDIRQMSREEFRALSRSADLDALENDAVDQAHAVSTLAAAKLARVRRAYILSAGTLAAWLLMLLVVRA